jgi:hypothetical protein
VREAKVYPVGGGLVFRIAEIPPRTRQSDGAATPWRGPMHASSTVDLMTVISGELWAHQLDADEPVRLKAGDTFIQRGSMHAWENRGDEPCVFSVVLVSATNNGAPPRPAS